MSARSLDQVYTKIELNEQDNRDFQNRRFGYSFLLVGQVSSGRVIVASPTRDPIARFSPEQFPSHLLHLFSLGNEYHASQIRRLVSEGEARQRAAKALDDIGDLEIDL